MKNLKINKKALTIVLAGTIALGSLTGCGNKQIVDFNKVFNVAIEENNGYVSIIAIKTYDDYEGDQVQYETEDGLIVLTSTKSTQLMKTDSSSSVSNYALMLAGNDKSKVIDYNAMQGITINTSDDVWNKTLVDIVYTFDKAIILSEETALVLDLETWKSYDDEKIQLKLKDGNCILTNMDNVKLINADNAQENSLFNYALSLVGDKDKVVYYNVNEKTR